MHPMKFTVLFTFALALFLAGCATPEEKEAMHQRQLAEEARLNFIALKASEHQPSQVAPAEPVQLKPFVTTAPVKPTPTPKPIALAKPVAPVKPVAVAKPKHAPPAKAVATAKSTPPAKPAPKPQLAVRTEKPPQPGDTVYVWNAGSQPNASSAHYSAAELKYARKLGKKPSQLTAAERQWARDHS
jgi:outer membrane biosynthesis protein TonB